MVSAGLIVFLGIGAILLGLGLRGYLSPAAKEVAVIAGEVQTLRKKLDERKKEKDAEKGARD